MADALQVTFELTRNDWIIANTWLTQNAPQWAAFERAHRRKILRQSVWMGPALAVAGSMFIGRSISTQGMYVEGAVVGLGLAGLVVFGICRLDVAGDAKRRKLAELERADLSDYVGRYTILASESGVCITEPIRELKLDWKAAAVHDIGDYILISHSGTFGALLPKNSVADPAATFAQLLAWWRAAQLSPAERVTRYLRDRTVECPKCKYNLQGISGDRCRECGELLTVESLQRAGR